MRPDLLALTPESLAALSSMGLVKRAQKELAEGRGPVLSEDASGAVTGTFPDGVVATLPPRSTLRDAACSCGAASVCRHRLAVALAYRESPGPGASTEAWSPAAFTDDELLTRLGSRALDRARRLRTSGIAIEVLPGADAPTARLPSCTVRFLVPRDLSYARCDCVLVQDCEHVALAVWAFGEAVRRDPDRIAERLVVALGDATAASAGSSPLEDSVRFAEDVLLEGVVQCGPALAQRIERLRAALEKAGLVWPALAVADLDDALADYRARSTRYRPADVTALLAELAARSRSASAPPGTDLELPASAVLGQGEAFETHLDHLRLVSLGARVASDGDARDVRVFLADPDTATVLVLAKRFPPVEGSDPPDAAALATRRLTSGLTLTALAHGQLVTRVARRRASRALLLGEGRGGLTSVTPQAGDWDRLPEPLLVRRVADLASAWEARPPRLLRPRVLAEDVHALAVARVEDVAFDPAGQRLEATLRDQDGQPVFLSRPYRSVAPNALEVLAAALDGTHGPVRFVSGVFERRLGAFHVDPLAVAADRLVVPDVPTGPVEHPLRSHVEPVLEEAFERAIATASGLLDEGAHGGLRFAAHDYPDRVAAAAHGLDGQGLTACGALLHALHRDLRDARAATTDDGPWRRAASAHLSAAIRLSLLRETL